MTTGYAQVATDCKRILKEKVRFSDALSALGPDSKNKGTINLTASAIAMSTAYSGKNISFEFRFKNALDLTEFQCWQQPIQDGSKNMMLVYTGKTSVDATIPSVCIIDKDGWVGAAQLNDIVYMVTDSNMSIVDADDVMNDVEAEVDDVLRRHAIITTPEGTIPDDLYFIISTLPVPRAIKTSVAYMTCYRIINDLFKAGRSIKPTTGKEELTDEDFALAYQWQKLATKALKDYIDMYNIQSVGNAPQWSNIAPMQNTMGVVDEAGGIIGIEDNADYAENTSDIYTSLTDKLK